MGPFSRWETDTSHICRCLLASTKRGAWDTGGETTAPRFWGPGAPAGRTYTEGCRTLCSHMKGEQRMEGPEAPPFMGALCPESILGRSQGPGLQRSSHCS